MNSRSSIFSKHKKSIIPSLYTSFLPNAASVLSFSKKFLSKNLLSALLQESNSVDYDELLNRAEILNEEQSQKILTLILKKDPEDRKLAEIRFLENKMQGFDFFQKIKDKIPKDNYDDLFRELRLETHQKNSVIFSYGDIGKKVFIILQGSVYVLVPKIMVLKQDDFLLKKFDNLSHSLKKHENFFREGEDVKIQEFSRLNFKHSSVEEEEQQKIIDKYPNFHIVNILKQGSLFGEVSLTLKEPRGATVICKEDSTFCILKSFAFERILKSNYDKEIEFLSKIALFKGMSLPNVAILKGYLLENCYNKSFVIFKPGDEANHIYIIREGELEIYKAIEVIDEDIEKQSHKLLFEKKNRNLIRTLTVGQTFGEEDIFLKTKRSSLVIVSSAHAKILSLKKQNFFDNLRSLHLLYNIEQAFCFKIKWQQNNIKNIIKYRKLDRRKSTISPLKKTEKIKNQIQTSEGKAHFLKALTLKTVKYKDFAMGHRKGSFSAHLTKIEQFNMIPPIIRKQEGNVSERRLKNDSIYDKKGDIQFEISPFLKMSAFSQLQKRKKKPETANMKVLMQDYEEEIRKQIVFRVCKSNSTLEKRLKNRKAINEKKNENEKVDIRKICSSLKMNEDIRQRFLDSSHSFRKIKEFKNNSSYYQFTKKEKKK